MAVKHKLCRWIAPVFFLHASLIVLISPIRAQEPLSTLRSESSVVLVPTLVRTKAGEITYGLEAKDFLIEDDGIEQDVSLDESPELEPVSLVVVIQVGPQGFLAVQEETRYFSL